MAISSAADVSMLQQIATYSSDVMEVSGFGDLEGMVDTVVASSCVSSQPQPPNTNQQIRSSRQGRQRQGASKLEHFHFGPFSNFSNHTYFGEWISGGGGGGGGVHSEFFFNFS